MNVTIIRSDRKTIAIQIASDLSVTVRAPRDVPRQDIDRLLNEKEAWILKNINKIKKEKAHQDAAFSECLSYEELQQLANKALKVIPERAAYFAGIIGVTYRRITIRNQKTRWGSCSSSGNLNFNCLLMLMPSDIIDYVVVHELCHRKEMNHSKAFWSEIEKVLPDYRERVKWLKDNGWKIMAKSQ